jgi:hypothetical protein
MFRFFWLKFSFVIFSFALFGACLIFLFFSHNDTLKNFVPAEADVYLHSTTDKLNSLPDNQRELFADWLEKHSSLSKSAWQTIFNSYRGEIGLFSINQQIFAIAKPTKKIINALDAQNISSLRQRKSLLFPGLQISGEKLVKTAWFNQIKQKVSFSDALIYIKNTAILPLPLSEKRQNDALVISANFSSKWTKLNILGPVGQEIFSKSKRQITMLPTDTIVYFYNILTEKITEKAEFLPQNFKFHLLKSLKGPVEFLETNNGFVVFGLLKYNSTAAIQQNISAILSQMFPTVKPKLLPDRTIAAQLIADPSQWQFVNNNQQQSVLNEKKLNLNITIDELQKYFSIKNNFSEVNSKDSTKINGLFSSCSIFHNQGAIFYPVNSLKLFIINKNENKIRVCIE